VTIHGTDKTAHVASYTDIAGSLRTKPPGSQENSSTTAIQQGMAVRRLTPTECERLQGFPDGWTAGQPDSARYKQLGNAWCVAPVRWLGERIMAAKAD
jgi:DNA (cytosine-5)-methyltransferase 1